MSSHSLTSTVSTHRPDLAPYESLYKHLHSHPELSLQERETANTIAAHLRTHNVFSIYEGIGGYGIAAVFKNGFGKKVLLRADIDALPVEEQTALPYASTVKMKDKADGIEKPVMHACGHDMHIVCLLAAAECLVKARDSWTGTLIVIFQPAEERGSGAQAMVDDGLYEKVPVPDYVLGQHVMPYRAGTIGTHRGLMASSADSMKITLYGRGGHASQPHRTIDPVVMASSVVLRLQTIVSREVGPDDLAVVTVGAIQSGTTENVISDRAELKVDVRAVNTQTREKVLAAVKRITRAECEASAASKEPTFIPTRTFPFTYNDEALTARLEIPFASHFGLCYDSDIDRLLGSEDFSILGSSHSKPCSFFVFGGTDPEKWDAAERAGHLQEDIPINHSPFFAPVIQPTMTTGVDALSTASLILLSQAE